ncbi:MAG: LysR substrate-binding domain-containing protein [Pseudomonadota bacterium]
MDTQALRLFILAAERANISRAGQSLGLAPAVSSARLAKLEAQLRVELLHRSTRRVALSPDGEAFLPYAREIVAQEDAGFAALGYGQAEVTGQLRFAAPSTLAQLHLVPLLPTFQSRYPKIELDLKLSDIQLDVIEGSFDLALRNAKPEDTSLKGRKLTSDTRVLCAAPSYLAAHGAPQDVADLREHAFIAFQSVAIRNVTLFVAVFPATLAQQFFMRGVELIGPGRAGVFTNLVPVFASALAVLILGEIFAWYHGAALVLVLGGIWLTQRSA